MAFFIFELKRILRDKKIMLFFAFCVVLSLYYLSSGVSQYQNFQTRKENFINFENQIFKQYPDYSKYGAYGFRVLYDIPRLNIFFNNSTIFQNIESIVDVRESVKIYHSFKGKNLFSYSGAFKDFSGTVMFFGSLFMIFMGASIFKTKNYLKFILSRFGFARTVLSLTLYRLLILDVYFILLTATAYFYVSLRGVAINQASFHSLSYFLVYSLLFLNFFYFSGFFLQVMVRIKSVANLGLILLWIVSIFLIPEINRMDLAMKSQQLPANEALNLQKLKTLMDFEQKATKYINAEWNSLKDDKNRGEKRDKLRKKLADEYQSNEFLLNLNRELNLKNIIENLIEEYESISTFYPSLYYSFLANEISSQGYYGYLSFLEYILTLRKNFMGYYLKRRYIYGVKKLETFVKNKENIFQASSHIPKTYWNGVTFTAIYILILFLTAYRRLKKKIYER